MKLIIIAVLSLLLTVLTGCGTPLTRLLPKLEKIELPEELMVPPKELKTIQKPEQTTPQAEIYRNVQPT